MMPVLVTTLDRPLPLDSTTGVQIGIVRKWQSLYLSDCIVHFCVNYIPHIWSESSDRSHVILL